MKGPSKSNWASGMPIPTAGDKSTIDPILERLDTVGMSRRDLLKATAVGVAAVGAFGMVTRTSGAAITVTPTKKGRLANLILTPNNYTSTMSDAGKKTAKILGLAEYSEANENLDPVRAVNLARQYAGRGFNMIWACGIDGSEVRPINQAATKAKAYHSHMWAAGPWFMPVDANEYFTAFWDLHDPPNIYGSTKLMLQEVSDRLGSKEGKIFHIAGFPGGSLAFRRKAGVHQAVKEFPKLKLAGELTGKWDPVVAQKAFQDLVGRYGKPDGVVCSNDAMLTGVLAAAKGLGYKPGDDVQFYGQDGNPDILNAIKRGEVFSTNFHGPHTFAVHPIVRMFDTLQGVQFGPLERQMWVNGINVTKANVAGVINRYYKASNRLPFDPKLASRFHNPKTWDPQVDLAPIDIEDYWKGLVKKPAGYQFPADYAAALKNGDMQKVEALYAGQYKVKMDNFQYKGVTV